MNMGQTWIIVFRDHFRVAFKTAGCQNDSLSVNGIFAVGIFDLNAADPSAFIGDQIDSRTVVAVSMPFFSACSFKTLTNSTPGIVPWAVGQCRSA